MSENDVMPRVSSKGRRGGDVGIAISAVHVSVLYGEAQGRVGRAQHGVGSGRVARVQLQPRLYCEAAGEIQSIKVTVLTVSL